MPATKRISTENVIALLQNFEELFDGTLGMHKMEPVQCEVFYYVGKLYSNEFLAKKLLFNFKLVFSGILIHKLHFQT